MPVIESLIGVRDLAKLLGLSQRSVWKLLSVGRCPPALRIGRSVRFRASECDRWIRAGCGPWADLGSESVAGGTR